VSEIIDSLNKSATNYLHMLKVMTKMTAACAFLQHSKNMHHSQTLSTETRESFRRQRKADQSRLIAKTENGSAGLAG
jgi:hypothetical protein